MNIYSPARQRIQPLRALALCAALAPAGSLWAASPQELMQAELVKWVAGQYALPVEEVTVAPLDARVAVQPCASGFSFDYPFVNRESVRVRCAKPAWQLYVKVGFRGSAPVGASAPRAPAPAPAAATDKADKAPAMRQVLVAASNLSAGQMLTAELVRTEPMEADKISRAHLLEMSGLEGYELIRTLRAGEPLRTTDLRPAVMVKKGELVLLTVGRAKEFEISVRLEAMQDGRLGEQIKLRNSESGRTLNGVVTGKGLVKGV